MTDPGGSARHRASSSRNGLTIVAVVAGLLLPAAASDHPNPQLIQRLRDPHAFVPNAAGDGGRWTSDYSAAKKQLLSRVGRGHLSQEWMALLATLVRDLDHDSFLGREIVDAMADHGSWTAAGVHLQGEEREEIHTQSYTLRRQGGGDRFEWFWDEEDIGGGGQIRVGAAARRRFFAALAKHSPFAHVPAQTLGGAYEGQVTFTLEVGDKTWTAGPFWRYEIEHHPDTRGWMQMLNRWKERVKQPQGQPRH